MKICDLTQFYSPVSGGVKRYLHEKIDYIDRQAARHEHVLIVPGAKTRLKGNGRSRVYTIRSPVVSRTTQYGAHLGSIQVKICFFTLGGWRERRTQRPCFARSEVCSDAGLMNFICSWSAMGPIEFTFGNCKCEPTIFRGFAIVPIRANSPAFIAPPISSFIPVFRKHLALQHWNARP